MVSSSFVNLVSIVSNLNFTLSIKLERGNYLIWRSQILPILTGHGIDGFVIGMKPCLDEFISVVDDFFGLNQMINPKYFYQQRYNQLILWLDDCLNVRRCCWSDCRLYHFSASLGSFEAYFCLTFQGKVTLVENTNVDNQKRLYLNN